MSYTTTGLRVTGVAPHDGGAVIRAACEVGERVVQLYVSGRLAGWAVPHAGVAEFELPILHAADVLFLLAVDADEAQADWFAAAFPTGGAGGNRLAVRLPRRITGYLPGDRWRVYVGDAGEATADQLAHEGEIYPQGRSACGFGSVWGGSFGFDGADAAGFGHTFGQGEFGFDCESLEWLSDPLPPGEYPVRVTVVSREGAVSSEQAQTVTLRTYPRPATHLAVADYTRQSDTLTLTWTPSPDV